MLSGVALTALLALVAVASRAHKPGGGSGASSGHVPRTLLEYAASVMIVLFPLAMIAIVLALAQSRRQKVLAGERSWRRSTALLLVMIPLFVGAFFAVRHLRPGSSTPITIPKVPPANTVPAKGKKAPPGRSQPAEPAHFQWLPVLVLGSVVLGLVVSIGTAAVLRRREGEAVDEEAALAAALKDVLADSLDDLRAERDPRRAVIRTYARMEKTFAAYGVPREDAEAPLEYLARVLDSLRVSAYAVRRLTQLFERAKFSSHEVDTSMKDDAIEALAGLRVELEDREAAA